MTSTLAARWPDRLPEVLACDDARGWLLTTDAGTPFGDLGNPPERWLDVLPRYAELQRGEALRLDPHISAGVPDLRTQRLAERFEDLATAELPLGAAEAATLRGLAGAVASLAADLAAGPVPDSVDHADLHHRSVFAAADGAGDGRILDWGDASIAHPFFTPFVTFHWLRALNGLPAEDRWFARLRDAYLEPWGTGLVPLFDLAQRLAPVARALAWLRHHRAMGAGAFPGFDEQFPSVLREAIEAIRTTLSA